MNWRTFSAVTATLFILPLGTYAAQLNQEANNIQEATTMTNLAQHPFKHGRKHRGGKGLKKLLDQLNLTADQSQQIETIQATSKTETESLRQQMKTNRQEMHSLFASDSSPEQLRDQYQKIQNLHQQLANNRFETILQVREVLTPEQRTQMAELVAQHKNRKGHHGDFSFNNE